MKEWNIEKQLSEDFEEKEGYNKLNRGIKKLEKGIEKTTYIGPLSSCNGLFIPLEEGAIIAHLPPDNEKEYIEELNEILKKNSESLSGALLFYKEIKLNPNADEEEKKKEKYLQKKIDLLKQLLEFYIDNVKKYEYTNNNTYIIIDPREKKITASPLKADLSPEPGFTPFETKY